MDQKPRHPHSKPPLAARLKRVGQAYPSDEDYGRYVVRALEQLLDTPLAELCSQTDEGRRFTYTPQALRERLRLTIKSVPGNKLRWSAFGPDGSMILTYKGALGILRDMNALITGTMKLESFRMASGYDPRRKSLRSNFNNLLVDLAYLLVNPPVQTPVQEDQIVGLKERLSAAAPCYRKNATLKDLLSAAPCYRWNDIIRDNTRTRDLPILGMPLTHYIYAASRVSGNKSVIKTARTDLAGYLGPKSPIYSLPLLVEIGLGNHPREESFISRVNYKLLYNLLVAPILPGIPTVSDIPSEAYDDDDDALPF